MNMYNKNKPDKFCINKLNLTDIVLHFYHQIMNNQLTIMSIGLFCDSMLFDWKLMPIDCM